MNKQHRREKIRNAKAALEAEAQDDAQGTKRKADHQTDRSRRDRPAKNPSGTPSARVPRNFTDPDSRIMKARDGFIQGYTAQAVVDAAHQVIVAHELPTRPATRPSSSQCWRISKPTRADRRGNSRRMPGIAPSRISRCWPAATGRHQHGEAADTGRRKTVPRTRGHAMKIRLKLAGYRSRYRLRKQVVKHVFGRIKLAPGFRQFLLRGLSQVAGEWRLRCRVHNMLNRRNPRRCSAENTCLVAHRQLLLGQVPSAIGRRRQAYWQPRPTLV